MCVTSADPMSACKHWHKKEARVYGCLLGEHTFYEEIILNKNKNKNKHAARGYSGLGILFENPLKSHTHCLPRVCTTLVVVGFGLLATWGSVGFYRQPWAVIP